MTDLRQAAINNNRQEFQSILETAVRNGEWPLSAPSALQHIVMKDNGPLMEDLLKYANLFLKKKLLAKDGEAVVTRPPVDFDLCLGYAGIGDKSDTGDLAGGIKPAIALALISSPQFQAAARIKDAAEETIEGSVVTQVLGKLLVQREDQTIRIQKIFDVISAAYPNQEKKALSLFSENALKASFGHTYNAINSGEMKNVAMLVAALSKNAAGRVLTAISNLQMTTVNQELQDRKLAMLAEKADPEVVKQAYQRAITHFTPQSLKVFEPYVGADDSLFNVALINACGSDSGGGKGSIAETRSLESLRSLLDDHEFDQNTLFTAMARSISSGKDQHLELLLNYGRERSLDVVNFPTEDRSTLLIRALRVEDKSKAERMGHLLMSAGASTAMDGHGTNPMGVLNERGMTGSPLYKVMEQQIQVAFAGQKAQAEMMGKIAALQQAAESLKQLGLDSNQMAPLLAGLLGGSAAPASPAQGSSHIARITGRTGNSDGTPPFSG